MSLGIVVKGTEGIVLAADSRVTLTAIESPDANTRIVRSVNFDNASKLLTFNEPHNWVAAVTFGDAVLGTHPSDLRTIHSFIPEFEVSLNDEGSGRISIQEFSQRLSEFFLQQWQKRMPANVPPNKGTAFVVGGYDENAPYGSVFQFIIPHSPTPLEASVNEFGVTWGGQTEIVDRVVAGYDQRIVDIVQNTLGLEAGQVEALKQAFGQCNLMIPYQVLPLQDCIDVAIFLIKTTVDAQMLSLGMRGVGGAIDVAVITQRSGTEIIQQKKLVGERRTD